MKECRYCHKVLPLSRFNVNRCVRDGLANKCKECHRAYAKRWRELKPEQAAAKNRQWNYLNYIPASERTPREKALGIKWRSQARKLPPIPTTSQPIEYIIPAHLLEAS